PREPEGRAPSLANGVGAPLKRNPRSFAWLTCLRAQTAETAVPAAILIDGRFEDGVIEIRPELGQEHEFGIGGLPGQEVRDPLLAGGPDDKVRVGDAAGIELSLYGFDVDRLRIESPCPHLFGQPANG